MAFTRIQIATVAAGSTNPNTLALTGCVAGRGLVACVTWDSTATVSAATMSEVVRACARSGFGACDVDLVPIGARIV